MVPQRSSKVLAAVFASAAVVLGVIAGCNSSSSNEAASSTFAFCDQANDVVTSCATSTACDKAAVRDCDMVTGSTYSQGYLDAVVACGVVCGDAGITASVSCLGNSARALPTTQAFTDFATAYCTNGCPDADCQAQFADHTDAAAGSLGEFRMYSDSYLQGLVKTCLAAPTNAGTGAECSVAANKCFTTYGHNTSYLPAECKSTSGS